MSDNKSILPATTTPLLEQAQAVLTVPEYNMLTAYMERGGHQLAAETAVRFFELYLNGSDCAEIHRLNKPFPFEAILWARIKYEWDKKKDEITIALTEKTKEKAVKAALETTGLLSDMLIAASKKHGDKLKKYIQTGNEEDLGDSMSIDNIASLIRAVEGLQKITGADRIQKIDKKETVNVNVNVSGGQDLKPETSAAILAAVAAEKRDKLRNGGKRGED